MRIFGKFILFLFFWLCLSFRWDIGDPSERFLMAAGTGVAALLTFACLYFGVRTAWPLGIANHAARGLLGLPV